MSSESWLVAKNQINSNLPTVAGDTIGPCPRTTKCNIMPWHVAEQINSNMPTLNYQCLFPIYVTEEFCVNYKAIRGNHANASIKEDLSMTYHF
jgi:hypothetical protein